jgi:hypothetical protein
MSAAPALHPEFPFSTPGQVDDIPAPHRVKPQTIFLRVPSFRLALNGVLLPPPGSSITEN